MEIIAHLPEQVTKNWERLRLAGYTTLAGLTALGAAACLPDPHPVEAAPEEYSVRVLGDSITDGAEHDTNGINSPGYATTYLLTDELAANQFPADVSAVIGASTSDLAYNANKTTSAHKVDITVLALSTNDRRINTTTGQPSRSIETTMSNISNYFDTLARQGASSDCTVIVGITETPQWGLNINGPPTNVALRQKAADMGGVFVDWAQTTADHPEYLDTSTGVHLVGEGFQAYRDAITQGAIACRNIIENNDPTTTETTDSTIDPSTTETTDTTVDPTTTESTVEPTTSTTPTTEDPTPTSSTEPESEQAFWHATISIAA